MLFQSLESKILKVQSDSGLMNSLIAAHEGFIRKCMIDQQKASGARLEDEMTVAMLAFAEAVKQYDLSKGKFLSFARLVITRRLVDEYRKQLKQAPMGMKSLDEPLSEEEGQHPYETRASVLQYEQEVKRSDLQMEIALYDEGLHHFNLTFGALAQGSPKQERLRDSYQAIASWLVSEPGLLNALYKEKKLPVTEILKHFDTDKKKLERGRTYIIGLVVLMNSDLELIKNYMKGR